MVIVGTRIVAADNSGARFLEVIKVLGSHRRKQATVADKVVVAVKNAAKRKKVKVHDVCTGIIIRHKRNFRRYTGFYISFTNNCVALIDKRKGGPMGTRIFGPYLYEMRRKKYIKFLQIASCIL
jgi:large subunit ribosomal protein L14